MKPKTLLAIIALTAVVIVLILYLINEDESFLEPINTGPPEVSQILTGDGDLPGRQDRL